MARSPQIPVYPGEQIKQIVEELADEDGRSASGLLLVWIKDRPEVQAKLAKLNGGAHDS